MIGSKGPPSHWPLHPQQQKTAPQASVPTEPIDGPQPAMPMGASSKHFPPIKSEFRTKYACATFFGFHKSLRKITVTAFCTQSHGRWMIIQMMFRICKWQIYIFRCQPFMFQDANLLFPPSFPCLFFQNSIVTGGFWISGWPWCLQFWRLRRSQDAQSAAPTSGCAGSSEKPNSTYFGVRKNASDIPTNFVSAIQKTMIITPFCPDKNSGRFSNLFRDFLEKPGTLLAQASSQSQRSDAKPQLFFEEKTNQPSKP